MKKIWYYPENYGTSIYEGENHGRLPKTMKLCFIMEKNYGYIPKQLKFLNKWISLKLWFTMEKLWYMYYGKKNYGTMIKNYDTLPRAMELWFTVEKAMVLWEKLRNYS